MNFLSLKSISHLNAFDRMLQWLNYFDKLSYCLIMIQSAIFDPGFIINNFFLH